MKRKVLGKGIEAIISNRPLETGGDKVVELDLDDVYPNPFQPRKHFSKEKIEELANSIRESGMIQPVIVFQENGKYFLYVGERRWRAAQHLKWSKMPAIIKDLPREELLAGALVENIQREDLNAIEIAEGIELLMKKNSLNHEQVAEKLGMNRSTVTNLLRLLRLPQAVSKSIIDGEISQGHARALLALSNPDDILEHYSTVLNKKLSVRQTETLVKKMNSEKPRIEVVVDPDVKRMEQRLATLLSTKVNLKYSSGGKGKIEIIFNQLEEFERIFKILSKE